MGLLIDVWNTQLRKIFLYFSSPVMLVFLPAGTHAQKQDTTSVFQLPISLDTFTVKSGFDVDAFIRRVRTDTTFYKAFKSMHLVPYSAVNSFLVFGKNDRVIASMNSKTQQLRSSGCRTTKVLEQKVKDLL